MTGFSFDWLALREPADAAARSAALAADFGAALLARRASQAAHGTPGAQPLEVVDLGAGAGANLRWLAPRLAGAQHWLLVDDDGALLSGLPAGVDRRRLDLAAHLDDLPMPSGGLVTASALLDLVSSEWLNALARRCAEAGAAVLFALTYDGRIDAYPADPADGLVRNLVNRHQRRDKGFGPALGPAAAGAAAEMFRARGYRILRARSDWRLGPAAAALQRALIEGWAQAAAETDPDRLPDIDAWRSRRLEHVVAGDSRIRVGHADVAGIPAESRDPR